MHCGQINRLQRGSGIIFAQMLQMLQMLSYRLPFQEDWIAFASAVMPRPTFLRIVSLSVPNVKGFPQQPI